MVLCVADEGGGKGMNNREKNIGSLALKSAPRRIIIPAADHISRYLHLELII